MAMIADRETTGLTIDGIRAAIAERKVTAAATASEFYARIKREDPSIGAFLTLSEDRAQSQAERIDKMAAEGKPRPPLAGVPIAIKDVMVTRDVRTTRPASFQGRCGPGPSWPSVGRDFLRVSKPAPRAR